MLMGSSRTQTGTFCTAQEPSSKKLYVTLEDSAKGTVLPTPTKRLSPATPMSTSGAM
jgi:hypothetical protein